jgi:hypothetical protein
MKNILVLLLSIALFSSCKDSKKEEMLVISDTVDILEVQSKTYPKELAGIFEKHGGIETWNDINNLCFDIEKPDYVETYTTSLKNRQSKIESEHWSIGNDGEQVWLMQNNEDAYQGNARFYHNLMFYFYAMPFIVSDDGIVYENIPSTELMGQKYAAIKISYDAGVGDSADDEYIIYYDPDSNNMEWLGYTVTYGKEGKNDDWHFIKYNSWQLVNGLTLPKDLVWYNVEDGKPVKARNTMTFSKVTATATILESSVFLMPKGAEVIEK